MDLLQYFRLKESVLYSEWDIYLDYLINEDKH